MSARPNHSAASSWRTAAITGLPPPSPSHPDCSHVVRRRGGCWPSCESSATRWQLHWPVDAVARCCRQATRTLARGCPQFSPVGDHGQCRLSRCRAGCERRSGRLNRHGLEIATLEIRRAGDIVPAFESLKDHADAGWPTRFCAGLSPAVSPSSSRLISPAK